jgi:hypothetical protein
MGDNLLVLCSPLSPIRVNYLFPFCIMTFPSFNSRLGRKDNFCFLSPESQTGFKFFISYFPFDYPASCILHPASCILHPASCILHPASCILHPASCIVVSSNKMGALICPMVVKNKKYKCQLFVRSRATS